MHCSQCQDRQLDAQLQSHNEVNAVLGLNLQPFCYQFRCLTTINSWSINPLPIVRMFTIGLIKQLMLILQCFYSITILYIAYQMDLWACELLTSSLSTIIRAQYTLDQTKLLLRPVDILYKKCKNVTIGWGNDDAFQRNLVSIINLTLHTW